MSPSGHRWRLLIIVLLGIGLYTVDLYLPLGVGNGVLYGGLVVLSLSLPGRSTPVIAASICSVLALSDIFLGPTFPNAPLWIGVTNRLLCLTAIWGPVAYFLQYRKNEEALRKAHSALEVRVEERTHELQASREELRALAGQLLTAQEEDRRRIARDLHDDVNQRLAMLTMDLRRIEKDEMRDLSAIWGMTRSITGRLSKVSDDVRQLAYRFHPSILDDLGLTKAVRRLVDDFSASTKLDAVFVHRDPVSPVPPDIATCIYRVAQESLNNVARHAQATDVEVELICEDDLISLSVRDNGVGFNLGHVAQSCPRLGLLSMKERVRLVHGMLDVVTAPGQGTHLQVQVPLQGAPDG